MDKPPSLPSPEQKRIPLRSDLASQSSMSLKGAQWIGDRKRKTTGRQPSPFLQKLFSLPGPVRKATLHWTALGVADLYLNGQSSLRDQTKRCNLAKILHISYL